MGVEWVQVYSRVPVSARFRRAILSHPPGGWRLLTYISNIELSGGPAVGRPAGGLSGAKQTAAPTRPAIPPVRSMPGSMPRITWA